VLDREQLRSVTLDDEELMRELVWTLIDDTSRQLISLQAAISEGNGPLTARLAHYSKGACANLGAKSAADLLLRIEQTALRGDLAGCDESYLALAREIDALRSEVASL